MTNARHVDLRDLVPDEGSLKFLYADVAGPFATVHYSEDGEEQPLALRLDLDKRVFLGRFEDHPEENKEVTALAASVARTVFTEISKEARS